RAMHRRRPRPAGAADRGRGADAGARRPHPRAVRARAPAGCRRPRRPARTGPHPGQDPRRGRPRRRRMSGTSPRGRTSRLIRRFGWYREAARPPSAQCPSRRGTRPMTTTTVHLVRHGEVHNPERILYGRLPGYRLSDRGEQMASLVGEHLTDADVGLVRSSPLLRAQQTAAPIAQPHGLEVDTDQRLIESGNHFEGHRMGHGEAKLSDPRNWRWFANPLRPSWGEPYREQVARVVSAVHDARAAAEGREAVLVLHQLPIWVTRLSAEGRPLFHDPRRRQCGLCSVTSLRFVGPHLADVDYAEPAAALYAGAVDATGGKLTGAHAPPDGACCAPPAPWRGSCCWPRAGPTPAIATAPGTPGTSRATESPPRSRPMSGESRSRWPAPPTTGRSSPPPRTTARCSCS